jgi:hypothetical protein
MPNFLKILQNVADEIGIAQPATGIGNANPEVLKMIRYADKVGNVLMKSFPWQILTKETTFTALGAEEQTGILPSDFDRICSETFWDRTEINLITGPITMSEWQGLKAVSYDNTENRKYRLRGDSILIIPSQVAGNSLAFEYVSNKWVDIAATGTPKIAFTLDTDIPIIDAELLTLGVIYEFLNGSGLPTGAAAKAYLDYFKLLAKHDQPRSGVMAAGDIFNGTQSRGYTGTPFSTGRSTII